MEQMEKLTDSCELQTLLKNENFLNSRISLGIDLGTTASVVSVSFEGHTYTLPIDNGNKTTPSIVNYGQEKAIVGRAAFLCDPKSNVYSVKRHMHNQKQEFFARSPVQVSADILAYLKRQAELTLNREIKEAVITVPAHFSDIERTATKKAASLANIRVLRLLNEPTAAALAFGLDAKDGIYGVYDLGGGTFDFSVLRIANGVFQVLSTGGDVYLGGDDIDSEILNYNLGRLNIQEGTVDLHNKNLARLVCKSLKENLKDQNLVSKKCVISGREFEFSLSKYVLEKIIARYAQRTFKIADQVIADAKISISEMDGIVLVGGMTKLDLLKCQIEKKYETQIFCRLNPEEAVALGASLCADSILSKNNKMLLIDVVPLTLGIETFGGVVDKIIYRNTPIPIFEEREYTTYADGQSGIIFNIVQGERALAKDCVTLGKFELSGFTKMPAGALKVTVRFSVDVNGLIEVSAYEKFSNIKREITIESEALSNDDVLKVLEDSFKHHEEDEKLSREVIVIFEAKRILKFWKTVLAKFCGKSNTNCYKIEAKFLDLQEFISKKDVDGILELKKELETLMGPIVEKVIDMQLEAQSVEIFDK